MDIPLKGNIREHSLSEILIDLNKNKASGTVSITTPDFIKNIYLKNGDAIFASSTLEDERLGEMFVKAGKISLGQYERSVEVMKETGKRQGVILVELGYITPKDLSWGIKYQVKEIIISLFHMEEGTYEFMQDIIPSDEVITLKISMENLIYEGVKRIDNWTRIKREMPDLDTVFALNEDPMCICGGIELSSEDRSILSLVDGERTMRQLIEESHMNSFDAMKVLYVLLSVGFIVKMKTPEDTVSEEAISEKDTETASVKTASEDETVFTDKVEELYRKLNNLSPSEMLQINADADSNEVKRNYYRLVRVFHPDRAYYVKDREFKEKVTAVFNALTKAYNMLKDETGRNKYFDSLGKIRSEENPEVILIREQFKRGVEELKRGNFWGASDLFRWVAAKSPKNPVYWSYLSTALRKIPHRQKEAEEALLEAIKLEPFNSEYHADLGLIYFDAGLRKRAEKQFEKALKLDPENAKAKKGFESLSKH